MASENDLKLEVKLVSALARVVLAAAFSQRPFVWIIDQAIKVKSIPLFRRALTAGLVKRSIVRVEQVSGFLRNVEILHTPAASLCFKSVIGEPLLCTQNCDQVPVELADLGSFCRHVVTCVDGPLVRSDFDRSSAMEWLKLH